MHLIGEHDSSGEKGAAILSGVHPARQPPFLQQQVTLAATITVLWIRNDLLRIRLQMFGVPDPDPTHFIEAYLEIIFKKILLSKKKKNILTTGICYFLLHTTGTVLQYRIFRPKNYI